MHSWSETSPHNCFNPYTWLQFFFFFQFHHWYIEKWTMWESLSQHRMRSTSLAVCRAGSSHVPLSTLTEVPSKKCEGRRDPIGDRDAGATRMGRWQMQTTRWRRRRRRRASSLCRRRSAMRHSTHNTRRTFPQRDAAATNVPARSFVASHRAAVPTSPSLFSVVAYGRCVVSRSNRYMWFDVGRQRRSRRPGSRRGESPRRVNEPRHAVVIRRLIVPLVYPSGNFRGGSFGSAFLERRNGGEKKMIGKRKKFSWDSGWIDLGKRDFYPDNRSPLPGCETEKRDIFRGMSIPRRISVQTHGRFSRWGCINTEGE